LERFDLGLALLSIANRDGDERMPLSLAEIAAWCGCSKATVHKIEQAALEKLRAAARDF
jgi:DNA-directed RNA polymerase sigma subunit (sigma70/sigma32)